MSLDNAELSSLSPDAQLILSCARTQADPETAGRIHALLSKELDWNWIIQSAFRNRVVPLLYLHLSSIRSNAIPQNILIDLRKRTQQGTARNIFLRGELLKILALLKSNHIDTIPYKGPLLSEIVYGNPAFRQFGDLDVLVHKKDVLSVKKVLATQGYTPKPELKNLTYVQEKALLQHQYTYDFNSQDGRVRLEMHWRITPPSFVFPLNMDDVWKRATPATLHGAKTLTLSPEDLLLVLCVSGAKHVWERLQRVCDVSEAIRFYDKLDWDLFFNNAKTLGVERIVDVALFLAIHCVSAQVPDAVSRRAKSDPVVKTIANQLMERLFQNGKDVSPILEEDGQFQPLHLKMRERFRDKIHYCVRLGIIPNVGEWSVLSLPRWLYFVYYVFRPLRLAGKYGSKVLKNFSCALYESTRKKPN